MFADCPGGYAHGHRTALSPGRLTIDNCLSLDQSLPSQEGDEALSIAALVQPDHCVVMIGFVGAKETHLRQAIVTLSGLPHDVADPRVACAVGARLVRPLEATLRCPVRRQPVLQLCLIHAHYHDDGDAAVAVWVVMPMILRIPTMGDCPQTNALNLMGAIIRKV